jgi:hypothetical protein
LLNQSQREKKCLRVKPDYQRQKRERDAADGLDACNGRKDREDKRRSHPPSSDPFCKDFRAVSPVEWSTARR